MLEKIFKLLISLSVVALVAGCATPKAYDYTALKESRPRSILVLPPVNESPDVKATYSMLSQVSYPLAEAGYYVLPVTLVDETFKQNGLNSAAEIHAVSTAKLKEIFGADAALYITVNKYGTTYLIIDSVTEVTANAKLVDLKTGKLLWAGVASASSSESGNPNGGGIIGALVMAAIKQIGNSVTDAGHPIAGIASQRLLSAGHAGGLLYGPRSVSYNKDAVH
jgi:hypothetical protein